MASDTQRDDFRADIGDNGTPPAFSDADIDRLFVRAGVAYTDDPTIEAEVRILGIMQLMGDAAKLVNYKQNESSESQSDIFKHLEKMLDIWKKNRDTLIGAASSAVRLGTTRKKPTRNKSVPWG
jgi:hypothetical protein